jgi:hypothetical protein
MYIIIELILAYSILIRLLGVYKKPKNVLMCGLFGACGLDIDYTKLAILGVSNDSRGGDGNGYFNGKNLIKGIDKLKTFSDHIKEEPLIKNKTSNIFLGHTRKATHGVKTEENTHPFLVGDKSNQIVLAHNGQIFNTKEMCKKYEVDSGDIEVDSKILAMLIHKAGAETILNEYKGWAALVWTNVNEPGSLYLYHGKSREGVYANAKVEEERPLYFIQLRNCIYFSSMIEPLKLIRETKKQKPFEVPHNRIIKLNNGKFSGKAVIINREQTNSDMYSYRYSSNTTPYEEDYYTRQKQSAYTPSRIHSSYTKPNIPHNSYTGYTENYNKSARPAPIDINNVHSASIFDMPALKKIFWWGGRYRYRNENIHGGQPTLITGALYVDKDTQTYEQHFPFFTSEARAEGNYSLGDLPTHKQIGNTQNFIRTGELQFFYEGVAIKNKASYEMLLKRLHEPKDCLRGQLSNPMQNKVCLLSLYSKYPICLLRDESIQIVNPVSRKLWYLDGKVTTCTNLKPQMSDVTISIDEGYLVTINKVGTGAQLSLPVGKSDYEKVEFVKPSKEDIETFTKEENDKMDEKQSELNAVRNTKVYESYIKILDITPKSVFHVDSYIDDVLEKALKEFLTDYHLSKTVEYGKMDDDERDNFINERFLEFIHEDVAFNGESINDAIETSGMAKCVFLDVTDYIAQELVKKFSIEGIEKIYEQDGYDSELESEIEDQLETLIDEDFIHEQGDLFQLYSENDFSQEIALAFYKSDDKLKSDLMEICERAGKTTLVEQIKQSKKILR